MTNTQLIVRHATRQAAHEAARRLATKYGRAMFAVTRDDAGIAGFAYPYAVVSFTGWYDEATR